MCIRDRLCFDPGVGFGKTLEESLALLAHVERTKVEGCAFLMAASRKRVTGAFCGNPPFEERPVSYTHLGTAQNPYCFLTAGVVQ